MTNATAKAAPEICGLCEDDLPVYNAEGVDITLIRWMLSLTPGERLQVLQDSANAILEIRARNPQI
jgi:hypothetical protein